MTVADLFDENNKNQNPTDGDPVTTPSDPFADKLMEIKNENGEQKYKDVETALGALSESQKFIEQLKAEKAESDRIAKEAAEKLEKMGNIEDFVQRVSPNAKPEETPTATTKVKEGLSEEQVAALVRSALDDNKRSEEANSNLTRVNDKLAQKFGDQAAARVKQKAEELGTTPAELKELSKQNPAMVLALFGGDSTPSTNPSQSTSFTPKNSDELKRPDPKGFARGGQTHEELIAAFRESREYTNKRLGIEQ